MPATKMLLEQMIAALDAQISDTNAVLRHLPIGGPESNASSERLGKALETRGWYRQLLRNCEDGQ